MMTPYDIIVNIIDAWCQEHYYGHFLVTLSIDGDLRVEHLYFETEDLKWVWENDWWEGQKDIKLIGFINMDSVYVSGSPDNYKILEMEELYGIGLPNGIPVRLEEET